MSNERSFNIMLGVWTLMGILFYSAQRKIICSQGSEI